MKAADFGLMAQPTWPSLPDGVPACLPANMPAYQLLMLAAILPMPCQSICHSLSLCSCHVSPTITMVIIGVLTLLARWDAYTLSQLSHIKQGYTDDVEKQSIYHTFLLKVLQNFYLQNVLLNSNNFRMIETSLTNTTWEVGLGLAHGLTPTLG